MQKTSLRNATLLACAAAILISSPAFAAMRITNLDEVAHTVSITGNGQEQRTIGAGDTEYFNNTQGGMVSVLVEQPAGHDKKGKKLVAPPKDNGVVHADGILSGYIGNARSTIPADPDTDYVISKGGQINVQSKKHNGGSFF